MGAIDKKIYQEVYSAIKKDKGERTEQYQTWLDSETAEGYLKCFHLAVQLRKRRLSQDAYEVSKALSTKNPSLQSFNMYLITAYDLNSLDQLTSEELKDIFDVAWDFSKGKEFEPNIIATMLKCCNRLVDLKVLASSQFDDIYSNWAETSTTENSFILAQYYLHLLSEGKNEEVALSFEQLSPELKTNQTLIKLYRESTASVIPDTIEPKAAQKATVISSPTIITQLATTLMYFSIQTGGIGVPSPNIIEKLNQGTYRSSLAIIIIPKDASDDVCMWSFVLGYCVHKFGKNNILLFAEDIDNLCKSPLSAYLTQFNAQGFQHEMDVVKYLGEKKILSVAK